jgi:hypothetical protein
MLCSPISLPVVARIGSRTPWRAPRRAARSSLSHHVHRVGANHDRGKSGSQQTRRWREMDSNPRSPDDIEDTRPRDPEAAARRSASGHIGDRRGWIRSVRQVRCHHGGRQRKGRLVDLQLSGKRAIVTGGSLGSRCLPWFIAVTKPFGWIIIIHYLRGPTETESSFSCCCQARTPSVTRS